MSLPLALFPRMIGEQFKMPFGQDIALGPSIRTHKHNGCWGITYEVEGIYNFHAIGRVK